MVRDIVMCVSHTLYSAALCNATHWNDTVELSCCRHGTVTLDNGRAIVLDTTVQKEELLYGIIHAGYVFLIHTTKLQ